MRQVLEDLWNYYLIETPIKKSKKEKVVIRDWSEKEKYFLSKLSGEQIEFFDEYDKALSEVGRISEKNAFVKGVMFATRFIFEALYNE